jgi:Acetyltransferase (GNAT) domain
MAELTYRQFLPGDEKAINEGFNDVFGLQRSIEEWQWKFPAEPEGRFIMFAEDATHRVMAHYAAVPVRLRRGELEVRAGQIVDVFSRPEARTGLATARAFLTTVDTYRRTYCETGILSVCYGFPSRRPLKLGSLRSGYLEMPPQPVHVLRKAAAGKSRLFHWHSVRLGFDPDAAQRLWARAQSRYAMTAVRDAAWLRRRLTSRPGVEYVHLVAWRRDEPAACAVVRLCGRVMSWVELVWDGNDARSLAALDRSVISLARAEGCERAELWLDGDRAATEALVALGWVETEHPEVWLTLRSFHPEIDPNWVPGHFYITQSDADLV